MWLMSLCLCYIISSGDGDHHRHAGNLQLFRDFAETI